MRDYSGLKSVDALARRVLSTKSSWRKECADLRQHNSCSPWSSTIFLERWWRSLMVGITQKERERRIFTIMHNFTDFTINPDDLNARSSKSKANPFH